jgi:hypothetical protein
MEGGHGRTGEGAMTEARLGPNWRGTPSVSRLEQGGGWRLEEPHMLVFEARVELREEPQRVLLHWCEKLLG